MFKARSRSKGFTLIELVIVIIILGILAALALPRFVDIAAQARDAATRGGLASLRSACNLFYASQAMGGIAAMPTSALALEGAMQGPCPMNQMVNPVSSVINEIGFGDCPPANASIGVAGWQYCTDTADAQFGARLWATNDNTW